MHDSNAITTCHATLKFMLHEMSVRRTIRVSIYVIQYRYKTC